MVVKPEQGEGVVNNFRRMILLLGILMTCLGSGGSAFAYTLSLSDATGGPGTDISIDIWINLNAGESLETANFDVNYDDSILTYYRDDLSTVPGIPLEWLGSATDPGPNEPPITFFLIPSDMAYYLTPGDHHLATINFHVLTTSQASTNLSLSNVYIGSDIDGNDLSCETLGSTVTISQTNPIPEPSTLLLFASGLAGLTAWGRRAAR